MNENFELLLTRNVGKQKKKMDWANEVLMIVKQAIGPNS
jgi:hypothetical protein